MRKKQQEKTWIIKNVQQIEAYTSEGKVSIDLTTNTNTFGYCIIHYYSTPNLIVDKKETFIKLVMQHMPKATTVEELAQACEYNKRTFSRLFKCYFGTTPYKWMLERKTKLIVHYLQKTTFDIKKLAEMFGFNTGSHFSSFCRNHIGNSPLEIRNKNKY